MRFHFPNATRVKKAALRLQGHFPFVGLAKWHAAISRSLGYRDWHDFESNHGASPATPLDENIESAELQTRLTDICLALFAELKIPTGDIQYALQFSRLTGNRTLSLVDHEAIRCACWRATNMPFTNGRSAGAVVLAVGTGKTEAAYLRRDRVRGGAVLCVTNNSIDSLRADFEVRSPRLRVRDFVPMRLYLPYGFWKTKSGRTVLFSRNYKPLWNISADGVVTRAFPWEWVKDIEVEDWFGGQSRAEVTWHQNFKLGGAQNIMKQYGISGLPILADIVPLAVRNDIASFDNAVLALKKSYRELYEGQLSI